MNQFINHEIIESQIDYFRNPSKPKKPELMYNYYSLKIYRIDTSFSAEICQDWDLQGYLICGQINNAYSAVSNLAPSLPINYYYY